MKLPTTIRALLIAAAAQGAGVALAADAAKPAFKADPAKGQQIAATCQACHTSDGSRGVPANPIIQGQHAAYIEKQLAEFKSGKRPNAVMKGMAAPLSDDDMKHVAAFYATKQAKPGFARNKDTVLLAEKIWRGGIIERQLPACSGCHSPNGAGIPSQYPRVSGQHADYTEAQLVAFRAGQRANNAAMAAIAGKLSDREIKALADYMAGLR
jgi:cytochrome c553